MRPGWQGRSIQVRSSAWSVPAEALRYGVRGRSGRAGMVEPVRVVILGGGFGGVAVAQELEKLVPHLDRPVEVTLISQSNYLLFVPMLPSAAAASVELTHILSPLRDILHPTRIRAETVEAIDGAPKPLTTTHPGTHRRQEVTSGYLGLP